MGETPRKRGITIEFDCQFRVDLSCCIIVYIINSVVQKNPLFFITALIMESLLS